MNVWGGETTTTTKKKTKNTELFFLDKYQHKIFMVVIRSDQMVGDIEKGHSSGFKVYRSIQPHLPRARPANTADAIVPT